MTAVSFSRQRQEDMRSLRRELVAINQAAGLDGLMVATAIVTALAAREVVAARVIQSQAIKLGMPAAAAMIRQAPQN